MTSQAERGLLAGEAEEVLRIEGLVKHFSPPAQWGQPRQIVHAVCNVSFKLRRRETVCLVGESGSGKSTTARIIMRLVEPTSGRVVLDGIDISRFSRRQMRPMRRKIQLVFQDPNASLNPRMRVRDLVAEPLRIHKRYEADGGDRRVVELLELVGLNPKHGNRFPRHFSGGQRQRIAIARAVALNPEVLLLDEPVSALDVSIRAQIVNLLKDLQSRLGLSYLLIAHDLSLVRHLADRVAVMYLGKIIEMGTKEEIFSYASHPYTQALLSATPANDPLVRDSRRRIVLRGDIPSPAHPPSGCRFRTRCWKAEPICAEQEPALEERLGHLSACHFPEILPDDVPDNRGANVGMCGNRAEL